MNNLIFLDIDGCLNSDISGTMWKVCKTPKEYGLCQDNIDNVKKILDNVEDSGIVWITSWRVHSADFEWEYKDGMYLKSPFPEAQRAFSAYPQEICDHLYKRNKVSDIWYYITKNRSKTFKNFAIIDDDKWGQRFDVCFPHQYFYSNPVTGVTEELANQVIEYFKNLN